MIANWERLFIAQEPILLDVLLFWTFPIVGLITFIEVIEAIILVGSGIASVLRVIEQRVRGKVITLVGNKVRIISDPAENYLSEWWGELKNKLCKPVTWVD